MESVVVRRNHRDPHLLNRETEEHEEFRMEGQVEVTMTDAVMYANQEACKAKTAAEERNAVIVKEAGMHADL